MSRPPAIGRSVLVFSAPNLAIAKMVEAALELAGVSAEVRGEQLGSLSGAIPVDQAYAQVWVDAAHEAIAKDIVASHAKTSTDEVRCPTCANENPSHFAACWNCDASLMGAPVIDDTLPATAATAPLGLGFTPTAAPSRAWPVLTIALLVSTAAFALLWLQARSELERTYGQGLEVSAWDEKNECLVTRTKATGALVAIDCDRNENHHFESHQQFLNGKRTAVLLDQNDDGTADLSIEVFPTGHTLVWFDHKQDGHFDEAVLFNARDELVNVATLVDFEKKTATAQLFESPPPEDLAKSAAVLEPLLQHLKQQVQFAGRR